MNESLITVRYVKALFELAEEMKLSKEVKQDMETTLLIIKESAEFANFLQNPLIKISEKKGLIDDIFGKKIEDISLKFLHLLIENKREMFLKGICIHYIAYYKNSLGIKEAVITTALPLKTKHRDEIFDFVSKKFKVKIELREEVAPEMIGGFVLRIEDQQINASLQAQLNKIKRELIHS